MNWKGIVCDVCKKPFAAEDDVVVCPDCGTPMHRSCYKELGHCPHQSRHAEGFVWSAPALEPSVPLNRQNAAPAGQSVPEGYVMCSRCGTVNPKSNEYCELCRYPLKKTGAAIPGGDREVQGENGETTFAEYMKEQYNVNPEEHLSEELTAREVAAYVGPNSLSFLYKFRAMLQNRSSVSFNLPAFFFNGFYCFYRKMYKVGLLVLAVTVLSYIPFMVYYVPYLKELLTGGASSMAGLYNALSRELLSNPQLLLTSRIANYIGLVLNVLCGLFFNKFYLKQVTTAVRVERIHGKSAVGSPRYYEEISRRGGTSPLSAVLLIVGILLLYSIFAAIFIL